MKRNGKNIITSDDVTILGKNSGKTLGQVLDSLQTESDELKSNVKWLYKHGGVGGKGGNNEGSGSTTTDRWTVICSLGGVQIPQTTDEDTGIRQIMLSESGKQRFYIHINNPGGDTYSVVLTWNGGLGKKEFVLNASNRWSYEQDIELLRNDLIHVSVMNGDMTEKVFDAKHIVNAYNIEVSLVNNNGIVQERYLENGKYKYNLFIQDIKDNGLKLLVKYTSAVNTPVTYFYQKFRSNEEVREETTFSEGDYQVTLLDIDAVENLQSITDDDAALYSLKLRIIIGSNEIIEDISADFLPNTLYLKILPTNSETIIYNESTENPQIQLIGNRSFTITPYNGKGGSAETITCTYFINDEPVKDINTGVVSQDSVQSGTAFQRTFMFQSSGENVIKFRASLGQDIYKDFIYYYYTTLPTNTIDWFNKNIQASASSFYKFGNGTRSLTRNDQTISTNSYIVKNTNDSLQTEEISSTESTFNQEMLINIGIQYNYINDENNEIIEIPTTTPERDTNAIHIYQNKFQIGDSQLQGVFFLEEEEKYDVSDNSKYHLITIARKFRRTINYGDVRYEISVYIDGVLQANTIEHVLPSLYDKFILKNGNYSINLLDISYFNNNTLTETDIVRYWYAYQTKIQQNFENVEKKSSLLSIFNQFNLKNVSDLYSGHVEVSESTLRDLVQNITVPVMCIEYEPGVNKDSMGNAVDFFSWSDYTYSADSHNAMTLTVGLKWSDGSGTLSTTLNSINTDSIATPDGQQKSAKFVLDIQGSTTRTYKSKNYTLGLEFTDSDTQYMPVYTPWFNLQDTKTFLPEQSFTLKADIVDSSHTNNTCMGKFINANTNKFDDAKQINSIYSGHIKNCLEGFPFLLFVHSTGEESYYFLGIYNFNLGRTSNFNLGYCDLRALPELQSNNSDIYNFNIYSIAKTTTQQQTGSEIKRGLITAEIDGNEAWFDFSQYDQSILFQLPNKPNDEGYMFSEIVSGLDITGTTSQETKNHIQDFVRRASRSGGYVFDKIERGFYDTIEKGYTLNAGYVPNARIQYKRIKDDQNQRFEIINQIQPGDSNDFNSQDLLNFIFTHNENDIQGIAPYGNFRSIVEYYTICMAFGLLDSVQKNLNIKSWNEGNTFYLAFYDMDTCLGINNDGDNVSYYAFSDYWKNDQEEIIDYDINGTPIVLSEVINVYRDYAPQSSDSNLYDVPSSYIFALAKYAKSVIQYYNLISTESSISLDSIITPQDLWAQWRSSNGELRNSNYFVENYYNGYMKGIDELMFNYNFRAKYFREEINSTYDEESSRFRGRSIGYIKDWLNKRFHILDAYFNLEANKEIYIQDGANYSKTLDPSSGYQIVYEQYPLNTLDYSSDVNINKSIFGETNSISGDINIVVQAPDYTPVIATVGRLMYRFLLQESSNKYNIRIRNVGTNKVVFGGSSMWTSIDSINSLAQGNVTIISDKLQTLNGNEGTANSWTLQMPALQELHLNSKDYTGDLIFSRNAAVQSPALRVIDISNSKINLNVDSQNVRTINLTNVKSGSIQIRNCSLIENVIFNQSVITNCVVNPANYIPENGTMTLSNNSITNLELSTGNNLNLNISNDSALKTLTVSGFKTITINNCPNLQTITSSGNSLNSFNITSCGRLETVDLNVTNCTSISIPNTPLQNIYLNTNQDFSKITKLDLSSSIIKKITYRLISNGTFIEQYVSQEGTINLTPLINLNDLNISSNINVKNIIFTNDFDKPIPIVNSFVGCVNLERIFGCIEIVNTYRTFYNLNKFTVHGELSSTWKNLNKTVTKRINGNDYDIVQTPIQLLSGEVNTDTHSQILNKYNQITKHDLFQEGSNVTNIFFKQSLSNTSFYDFMNGTNITQFDVYYMLNSFGLSNVSNNVTLGNGAFYSKRTMFDYSTGNQLNRYTFYKCNKITSFSASTCVFNASSNYTLLYSPTKSGDTFIDNGLLSPLTELTNITRLIDGVVCTSRFLLRKSSGNYNITGITWQTISLIYDDIDNYEISSIIPPFFDPSTRIFLSQDDQSKLGNLTDMFKQTPNLQYITDTFGISVINYDTLVFPNTIITIKNAFNSSYGFGTFNWKKTFDSNSTYSRLETIANSFKLGNFLRTYGMQSSDNNYVKFELSNSMFDNMPNLQHLGYIYTSDYSGGSVTNNPSDVGYNSEFGLHGEGFDKVLEGGTFPYNITSNIPKIVDFVGLFSELYAHNNSTIQDSIDIPRTLFVNNGIVKTPQLNNIACLFKECNILLNLTSEGFKGCINLSIVNQLFACSLLKDVPMLSEVKIPYRFFYLGEETKTKTYYGTNSSSVMEDDIAYTEDPETGAEFDMTNPNNSSIVTYKVPIKKIEQGARCFYGEKDLRPYKWNKTNFDITQYPNSNYIPFAYYKDLDTGEWKTRPDDPKYTKLYDISSIYDGNPANLEQSAYCQDSEDVDTIKSNQTTKNSEIDSIRYFCPPDIFESFSNTSNTNINGFFQWCGYSVNSGNQTVRRRPNDSIISTNMYGRICPYLFNTINNIVYLIEFFEHCKGITSYNTKSTETKYLIPPNLFREANKVTGLCKTFAGMYFDTAPNYQFLSDLKNTLDIRGIFSMCMYNDNYRIGNQTFAQNTLSYVDGAFCNRQLSLNNNKSVNTSTATNNVPEETNGCTFTNVISGSKNADKTIGSQKQTIKFLYFNNLDLDDGRFEEDYVNLKINNNITT